MKQILLPISHFSRRFLPVTTLLAALSTFPGGCGLGGGTSEDQKYYTSGSREADQRAEQRIARTDQLQGKKDLLGQKRSLYERLNGESGVKAIVDDFVVRVLADPRVNFERTGITHGGVLGIGRKSEEWKPTDDKVAVLKQHFTQFLALATGGPPIYEGRDIKSVHEGMKIDNPEFDAAVGDLKATLDKLKVGIDEQKELLAIVESTRPQIVEKK